MSLKIVIAGNSLEIPVDPEVKFEPGMISKLYLKGRLVISGVKENKCP